MSKFDRVSIPGLAPCCVGEVQARVSRAAPLPVTLLCCYRSYSSAAQSREVIRSMRYVVARVINSPRGAVRTARLLITDVPEKTSVENVLDALTSAGKAAEFSEAGVPFGNHEIKPDSRGWPYGISGIDEAPSMTWEKLTRTPTRNEGRRATLRFTDAEFATVSLAAQRADKSLQQWALDAMLAAAEGQGGAEAAPAPRVTKTTKRASVPLAPAEAG